MSKVILTVEQLRRISVKRNRISATQGFALICVDGIPVEGLAFGDEPTLHKDGFYRSDTPDIRFIKAALHHPYDYVYHLREKVIRALQNGGEKA